MRLHLKAPLLELAVKAPSLEAKMQRCKYPRRRVCCGHVYWHDCPTGKLWSRPPELTDLSQKLTDFASKSMESKSMERALQRYVPSGMLPHSSSCVTTDSNRCVMRLLESSVTAEHAQHRFRNTSAHSSRLHSVFPTLSRPHVRLDALASDEVWLQLDPDCSFAPSICSIDASRRLQSWDGRLQALHVVGALLQLVEESWKSQNGRQTSVNSLRRDGSLAGCLLAHLRSLC